MSELGAIALVALVTVGFVVFLTAAAGVRFGWAKWKVITIFVVSILLLTVIPVALALSLGLKYGY